LAVSFVSELAPIVAGQSEDKMATRFVIVITAIRYAANGKAFMIEPGRYLERPAAGRLIELSRGGASHFLDTMEYLRHLAAGEIESDSG
jgi:hypothetical protein